MAAKQLLSLRGGLTKILNPIQYLTLESFLKPKILQSPSFSTSPLDIPFPRPSTFASGGNDFEAMRNSRPMDFVRGIIEEDGSRSSGYNVEQNADFVHINIKRNNTFVAITDSKGNKKFGTSSGCVEELKGGVKQSRYVTEATAEFAGRVARNLGLNSVVVKVKGFTYFRKKRQAIMSFKEGFGGRNPIVYIEDTTRRPHNGCRLRKKRRI